MLALLRRFPFTSALIAVLVAVFGVEIAQSEPSFWLLGHGQLPDIAVVGVVWAPAIADGELWRIVTAGFLHAGLLHLALNVYALSIIGTAAEARLGPWRTAVIFFAAMIGGNIAAMYFQQDSASLGASGGVMGLAGSVVVRVYRSGEGFSGSQWVLSAIVMTLAFGFINPGISNSAHIGGLLTGALVALPMGAGTPGAARRVGPSRAPSAPRRGPGGRPFGREPVNKRQEEFQRRIDEAVRKAAEERAREQSEQP